MNTVKFLGMLLLMLCIGAVFFLGMGAGQFGFIQHMAGNLPEHASLIIAWAMPATMLLFLLYGTGVLGEFLKPLEERGPVLLGAGISVLVTALVSSTIFMAARASLGDAYFMAGTLDLVLVLCALLWFLVRLGVDRQGGFQNST